MNGKNAAEPRKERTKTMKIDRKRMQWECVITLLTALLMSPNHAAAKSPVFTTIYDFTGGTGDGAGPGGVVVGSGGVLYGATAGGGAENAGTVYSLTRRWVRATTGPLMRSTASPPKTTTWFPT